MSCRWIRPPASCCRLPLASRPSSSYLLPPASMHFIHCPSISLFSLPIEPLPTASRRPKLCLHILHPLSLTFLPSPLSHHLSPISCHHAHYRLPPPLTTSHHPGSTLPPPTSGPSIPNLSPPFPTTPLSHCLSPLSHHFARHRLPAPTSHHCLPPPIISDSPSRLPPPASRLPTLQSPILPPVSSIPLSHRLSPPPRHHAHLLPLHPSSHRTKSVVPLPIAYLYPLGSPSRLSLLPFPSTYCLSPLLATTSTVPSRLPPPKICCPASRHCLSPPRIRPPTARLPTSITRLSLSFPLHRAATSPLPLATMPTAASHRATISPLPLTVMPAATSYHLESAPLTSLPSIPLFSLPIEPLPNPPSHNQLLALHSRLPAFRLFWKESKYFS